MWSVGRGPGRFIRAIHRTSREINRAPRKRRRRPKDAEPAGPRLVRGRGLARRRRTTSYAVFLCWLLAAAFMIVVFKYFIPIMD